MSKRRLMLIGLDCAAPELVFERYRDSMPHVSALMERGIWGKLRSSEPPITVPAWTCMVSGRDPGELGLYGFRNRVEGERGLRVATAREVRVKRLWDWLGDHGKQVSVLFVPLTSPPSPVRGQMVSGFLWPGEPTPWCYPRALEAELTERFGPYRADVENFRSDDLQRIYDELLVMTEQHFAIAEHVWTQKSPDFMMMVEIGVDRLHHAFWRHIDPEHPRHEPGNPWQDYGRRYYAELDARIGSLLKRTDEDTSVLILSDHGARAMHGGFCINEWLIREGYLVLKEPATVPRALNPAQVDWTRSRAWAEGGYYARVFLNVAGREPGGIVPAEAFHALRSELSQRLAELSDDDGQAIRAEVHIPQTHYRTARGFPPDLMVYFDELALRAVATVGTRSLIVTENDQGPDSCNHAWDGMFVFAGATFPALGRREGASLYDLAPTVLGSFGIDPPPGILGRDWSKTSD